MNFRIELEEEADGRWIGAITELPGVLAYGKTRMEAAISVIGCAMQVIADELQHGELLIPESEESPSWSEHTEELLGEFTLEQVRLKFSLAA